MKIQSKWNILFTVVIITLMASLDSSIVNVGLPVMSKELAVSMGGIEWAVTSYLITICATILLFGRLGDTKGKVNVFRNGILVFTIGSLLCAIATNLYFLIFSRVVQAIGAAAAMATNQGIITETFPPSERGRALGIIGSFVALGTMIGPTLGGLIVDSFRWEYIFIINLPIGIITYLISFKTLPKEKGKGNQSFDLVGALLFMVGIIMLFSSIILGQSLSYSNPYIIISFITACILFFVFIKVEQKVLRPLLDINIFKNKLFSLSIFCGFTSFVAIGGTNIILPFYFQDALKLSPSFTGILMTVAPIILSVVSPVSGYLSDKFGSEKITFIGLIMTTLGLALIGTLKVNSLISVIILFIAIMSFGNAMFQSPNNSLVMSTVDREKLGIAGSINALVRNLGMTMGISISTTLLYNRMSSKVGYEVLSYVDGRPEIFIYGMEVVFFTMAGISLIGAIFTFVRIIKKNKKEILKE